MSIKDTFTMDVLQFKIESQNKNLLLIESENLGLDMC